MKTITVQERQTLLDISAMYCGDAEAVFEIIQLNDLSITEILQSGQEIIVPESYARKITEFYQANHIQPATAYIEQTETAGNGIMTNDHTNNLITNDHNSLIIENNE